MTDDVLLAAVRENAAWCDLVASAHGHTGSWAPTAWTCPTRTPALFPDAVTLSPAASAGEIVDRIDTAGRGATVKDSFSALELNRTWAVLLEGSWLRHAPPAARAEPWGSVGPGELEAWLAAWGGPPEVLRPVLPDPSVAVVARRAGDTIVGGAVLHDDGTVIGVSNLFAPPGADPDATWSGALAAADRRWPGRLVVGYETGDDLVGALARGSLALGPLRVLIHGVMPPPSCGILFGCIWLS